MRGVKELDQLRNLLIGPGYRDLEGLRERIEDPARRSRDLAQVLPEAFRLGGQDADRLADALQDPVGRCIRRSIERDTKLYADALFPVMGPAIRRSISETLKSFVQSINQAVATEAPETLDRAAAIMIQLGRLGAALRLGVQVRVVGHSDGVGSERRNLWLRRQRADLVRGALSRRGVNPSLLAVEAADGLGPSATPAPHLRRVSFSVFVTPPTLPSCAP